MQIMLLQNGSYYRPCLIGISIGFQYLINGKCITNILSYYCSLWAPIHVVLFNTLVFLLSMAHIKAVISDPGRVPLPQSRIDFSDLHSMSKHEHEKEEWTVCTRCETYRPPRAHHCRICKRCIR